MADNNHPIVYDGRGSNCIGRHMFNRLKHKEVPVVQVRRYIDVPHCLARHRLMRYFDIEAPVSHCNLATAIVKVSSSEFSMYKRTEYTLQLLKPCRKNASMHGHGFLFPTVPPLPYLYASTN